MKGATWSQKLKLKLQQLDAALGAWFCRRFPKFAQSQGFNAGASFGADLQIKVIRGNQNEKKPDSQTWSAGTFWNRMGKKR
jgi:hypothetical protein